MLVLASSTPDARVSSGPANPATGELDALLGLCLAGDHDAFARLVELKRNQVLRTAYQQCGDAQEARLIAQSVFVRIWQNLHQFDRSRRFDTWLYQVTINAAIDHHRRRSMRFREDEFDETFVVPGSPDTAPAAEIDLSAREVQRILVELTQELPDKQRAAFVLREIEGLTTGEAAEALGTTESTVRNHVFQARIFLRKALLERYPEYARGGGHEGARS